jgi:hypothetical protein
MSPCLKVEFCVCSLDSKGHSAAVRSSLLLVGLLVVLERAVLMLYFCSSGMILSVLKRQQRVADGYTASSSICLIVYSARFAGFNNETRRLY